MKLHHLRITCRNLQETKSKFLNLYSFREYGYLVEKDNQGGMPVMRHRNISIVFRENKDVIADTIDDIAFCLEESLSTICQDVRNYSGTVLQEPFFESCETFSAMCKPCSNCVVNLKPCLRIIEKMVLKSSVGNLEHTLIRKEDFHGEFLVGFVKSEKWKENEAIDDMKSFDSIDHIALAVPCGQTLQHMAWYRNCLHLHKFNCNKLEKENGLVIRAKHGRGLRLFTLIEHPCSGVGVSEEVELGNGKVKFVFCESLTEEGSDQIQKFLTNHHGAGVQHVAFHSTSIIYDTQEWYKNGVSFLSPPKEYYQVIDNTLTKFEDENLVNSVQELGILIDVEKTIEDENLKEGYLYQVFTNPISTCQTFFFELIQRDNSFGFGAGNVAALWNALDMSLNNQQ